MKTITILVVDDHAVVRTGLRSLLNTQEGLQVVAEAANGEEAVEKYEKFRPDVVVMDITMPVVDGMTATRRLLARDQRARILALTVHEDKQFLFEMLAAGARGYISKQAAAQELVEAIRTVAAGGAFLQPQHLAWLIEEYRRLAGQEARVPRSPERRDDQLSILSAREIQVVELVAAGHTTPEIAEILDLSPKTVSRHRERIMQKLNINSTVDLVKFAIQTGLARVE